MFPPAADNRHYLPPARCQPRLSPAERPSQGVRGRPVGGWAGIPA